ncbi:fungal specific transcription factor domain-containing protein [Colletotrichum higginsianum]|nr:fungal specific transcription factor domain-containing protein [Colletotrichum higginsianum]
MPQFLDFLHVYASRHSRDRELRFSGFRTDKTLTDPVDGAMIPELGRSGRRYQLCFNLKTVSPKDGGDWKIRQAVFHHQFDLGQGTQLWIIGDPHATLKKRIVDLFPEWNLYPTSFSTVQQGFATSLEVNLDFAQWATSEWRWHILFLEERAEELTKPARIREKVHIEKLDPESLSDVQKWEEKTNDTIMAMESNVNIMRLQQKFYQDLVKDDNFPQREQEKCRKNVECYVSHLEELICETQMQITRANILVKTVGDRKTITFFSTDIIKFENGEVFSQVALERFLQVTLPLMFLTFFSAGLWFWMEWRKRAHRSRRFKIEYSDIFPQDEEKV